MKIGDLVKTKINRLGISKETLGMIIDIYWPESEHKIYNVQFFGEAKYSAKRRWLPDELELASANVAKSRRKNND